MADHSVTTAIAERAVEKNPNLIAARWHLLAVLAILALNAYRSWLFAEQARAGTGPARSVMYLRTIFFELLVLGIVAGGVKRYKSSLDAIFGQRWKSWSDALRDLGIGVALWCAALVMVSMLSAHGGPPDRSIGFLLPQSSVEIALWLVVSLAAGISEEAVYRGYLQRQFAGLANNAGVGICASAAAFGAVHLYQGLPRATVIAASAIPYGVVAQWRRSTKPGMAAHTLQDAIAPLLLRLVRH